eukprot:scaffold77015_cov31-Tisochrysis_lutea.AAC.1
MACLALLLGAALGQPPLGLTQPTSSASSASLMSVSAAGASRSAAELRELREAIAALPSQAELMRRALDGALNLNRSLSLDERVGSLIVLQELVEDLENARDLKAAGGFREVLTLLQSEEQRIQANAVWVLGTAAQNANELQHHLCTEVEAMGPILRLLLTSESAQVRAKALYACSALVRAHPAGQLQFEEIGGVNALIQVLAQEGPESKLSLKALVMLTDMLMHASSTLEAAQPETAPASLALTPLGHTLQMNASTLCESLLAFLGSEVLDAQEKAVQLLEQMLVPEWRKVVEEGSGCPFEDIAERLRVWWRRCAADGNCDEIHERAEGMAVALEELASNAR